MKEDNNLESPGPKERTKGTSRTLFKDTLTRAALENDSEKLRKLCNQIWDIALDGSLPLQDRFTAMKMIMERIDGRPAQAIEIQDNTIGLPSAGQFKIVKIESQEENK